MAFDDYLNTPIELAATSPRLDMIRSRLKTQDIRPYPFRSVEDGFDPLLVDTQSASPDMLQAIQQAADSGLDRPLILLGDHARLAEDAALIL
ncbi:MAG: hypothetical protein AAGJ29_13770, partial [Pseudomonadota bacterium]